MKKIENRHVLPSNCRYFDKTFTEMFFEESCITHICVALCSFVLEAMKTKIQKDKKKYLKIIRNHVFYEAETL